MTVRAVQQINRAGVTPTYNAAAASDQITGGGTVFVHVKSANGSPVTLTIPTPGKVEGLDVADFTATIPATTGDKMIGPLPEDLFKQADDGKVDLNWSSTTSVTWAALRI